MWSMCSHPSFIPCAKKWPPNPVSQGLKRIKPHKFKWNVLQLHVNSSVTSTNCDTASRERVLLRHRWWCACPGLIRDGPGICMRPAGRHTGRFKLCTTSFYRKACKSGSAHALPVLTPFCQEWRRTHKCQSPRLRLRDLSADSLSSASTSMCYNKAKI